MVYEKSEASAVGSKAVQRQMMGGVRRLGESLNV